MSRRPGAVLTAALLLLLVPLGTGCTADEESVEGKACVFGSNDPAEQCVAGFECVPHPDGALCEPIQLTGLRVSAPGLLPPIPPTRQGSVDPSVELLRQLGLDL